MSIAVYLKNKEKERSDKVKNYKKTISEYEEDWELFYKHKMEREEISEEQYALSLKERHERYAQYAKDVLEVHYMTEEEKAEISREYMQESEQSLTDYVKRMRSIEQKAEKERLAAEKEQQKAEKERIKLEAEAQKQAEKEQQLKKEMARDELDSKMEVSREYVADRDYYSNWEKMNDDPISAFKRVDTRLSQAVFSGTISYEEYRNQLAEFGTFMYEDRISNSNRWLAHEREMNRISSEDYIAGLDRMKTYTQEYYSAGIISHRQYLDGMRSLEERVFSEKVAQHKEILRQADEEKRAIDKTAQAKIKALEKRYSAQLAEMDEDEREDELAYLKAQEKIYANAQTKEGKDRLAQIREDIEDIKDEERRIALKENLEAEKENILSAAEKKKESIDINASRAAIGLGLYYDEDTGYRMISSANSALSGVLTEQTSFSEKSYAQMDSYNTQMSQMMNTSMQTVASGILENFQSFASGISAIKNQIFSDVESVNSLDFSRFGVSGGRGSTTVTYNDYGDKNISGSGYAASVFDNIKSLIAKGGRL